MVADIYAEARSLERDLDARGMHEWSQRIEDVIAGGSTSTEILMGLRWTLDQLLNSLPNLDADVAGRIRQLLTALNELLR